MNIKAQPVYLIFLAVLGLVLLVSCSSPKAMPTSTAISPTLTATTTLPATETPTPTVPPGIPYVRINKITVDDQNRYVKETRDCCYRFDRPATTETLVQTKIK